MTACPAVPCSALHFRVHFSGAGAPGHDLGFSEVVFPPFPASGPAAEDAGTISSAEATVLQTLVLRRGFDGRLDLYRWWDQSRRRQARRGRTVRVELLDAGAHETVVTWRFTDARPLQLAYSPLDALLGGVLIETLTLGFKGMSLR